MARERALTLKIAADAKQAQRELAGLSKAADKHGTQTERAMSKVKGSLLDLGVAGAGLFAFNEFNEAQKVAAQTEAAIRSTGKAANVTADEVEDLSGALSEKAAVDDELIQSGANLLLTFTKVRNEVGEGNDIFNQATETALDLSVALGTDMTSASMMLGKALNDPIKGLTTLGRAGVQFTADQKEQIRTLVETGDLLGAQKIILKELETQVGGSAEAQATGYDRAKVAAGNLAEAVGGVLAPAVQIGAGVATFGAEQFQKLDQWQQQTLVGLAGAGYVWMRWGDTAVEAMLNLTGSSRDAAGAVSSVNSAIGKGAAAAAVGLTSYALTYEALESLVEAGPDVANLADDLASVGEGSFGISDAFRNADTDAQGMAKAIRLLNQDTSSWTDSLSYQRRNMDLWGLDLKAAKKDLEGWDAAFAEMVESGNADEAQEAFAALTQELLDQGLTYTEIVPLFDEYYTALEDGAKQNGILSGAVGVLTDTLEENGDEVESNREAYKGLAAEVEEARRATADFYGDQSSELRSAIAAEQAIDDMTKSLLENGETWNKNTEKGRNNLLALDQWRQSAVEASLQTDNAAASMHGYTMRLAESMMAAGMTKEEVDFLLASLGLTPKDIYTKFSSNADEEKERVGGYIARIKGVPQQWYTDFIARGGPGSVGSILGFASGGRPPVGVPSMVGERGPEIFVPDRPGTIVPNHQIGNAVGGSQPIVVQLVVDSRTLAEVMVDPLDDGLTAKQRAGTLNLKMGKGNLVGVF